MLLASLTTLNFRNLAPETLRFGLGVSFVWGENGAGKTNLLEAAYLGMTGLSEGKLEQLVQQGQQEAYVRADLQDLSTAGLGVSIQEVGIGRGRKQLKVDGVRVRQGDLPRGSAVWIRPEDIELVFGAPAARRQFLDSLLSRISVRYALHLSRYERLLSQRNAALRQADHLDDAVEIWNAPLMAEGLQLLEVRRRAMQRLQPLAQEAHAMLGSRKTLSVQLSESTSPQSYAADLEKARPEDLARGHTTVGPHRDDLKLLLEDWPAHTYASRGEGRTIALALRHAELTLLTERYQRPPLLLIDDFSAELDPQRRAYLLQLAASLPQAIVTATEDALTTSTLASAKYQMRSGRLLAEVAETPQP